MIGSLPGAARTPSRRWSRSATGSAAIARRKAATQRSASRAIALTALKEAVGVPTEIDLIAPERSSSQRLAEAGTERAAATVTVWVLRSSDN